jgi:hypothetical protein
MKKGDSISNITNMLKTLDFEPEESIDSNDSEQTWNNLITLETFNNWISVASFKIECLDLAITNYRWRLQTCVLLGLLLSTISGTISVTQFSNYPPRLKFGLNLVMTITSFSVAFLTGIIKTFKLQEALEEYINLKQNWVAFSAKISNEIYLPKKMRSNAETIIKDNKARFLDLLKVDIPIPKYMSILAAKHLDKGNDIESQYYKYRENIITQEQNMNHGCMKTMSFFYDCCYCCYKPETVEKITENRELERIIKYSKVDNESKYKRKAYQYTLSSIMSNNVKNEYNEIKAITKISVETQTQTQTQVETQLSVENLLSVEPGASLKDTINKDAKKKDAKKNEIKGLKESEETAKKIDEEKS